MGTMTGTNSTLKKDLSILGDKLVYHFIYLEKNLNFLKGFIDFELSFYYFINSDCLNHGLCVTCLSTKSDSLINLFSLSCFTNMGVVVQNNIKMCNERNK